MGFHRRRRLGARIGTVKPGSEDRPELAPGTCGSQDRDQSRPVVASHRSSDLTHTKIGRQRRHRPWRQLTTPTLRRNPGGYRYGMKTLPSGSAHHQFNTPTPPTAPSPFEIWGESLRGGAVVMSPQYPSRVEADVPSPRHIPPVTSATQMSLGERSFSAAPRMASMAGCTL